MKKPLYILLCIVLFIGTLSISIKNKMKNIFGGELFQNFALAGEAVRVGTRLECCQSLAAHTLYLGQGRLRYDIGEKVHGLHEEAGKAGL